MYINSRSRTVMMLTILLITIGFAPGIRVARADQGQHQDEHQHAAPHGGQMVDAGHYRLEIVFKEHQTIQVYMYDDNSQPMAVPVQQATLYLRLPGNQRQTLTLEAAGSGTGSYLTTTADLHDVQSFDAALRIALDGEPRNLRFAYQEKHAETPHTQGHKR